MTWLFALTCAVSAAAHLLVVVPRLPAPVGEPDGELPDYPGLATPRAALLVGLVAGLGALLVARSAPTSHLAVWFGYLGAGAALVWVDRLTTFLPRVLTLVAAAQMAAGVAVLAVLHPSSALGAAAGAVAAFGLFYLLWRFSRSLGFGDVRLAALVGAVGGLLGISGWITALALGTLVGAVWGIAHTLLRRRSGAPAHFAYGPALWLGPLAAAALNS